MIVSLTSSCKDNPPAAPHLPQHDSSSHREKIFHLPYHTIASDPLRQFHSSYPLSAKGSTHHLFRSPASAYHIRYIAHRGIFLSNLNSGIVCSGLRFARCPCFGNASDPDSDSQ